MVLENVVKHFSPEFVNRIDETVVFHPLYQNQIRGIAEIQIDLLNRRLADNELSIQLSSEVLDHISIIGYDPVYGARPLKRAIENLIENPLAEEVLRGGYLAGDTIAVELHSTNGLVFGKLMTDLDQAVV